MNRNFHQMASKYVNYINSTFFIYIKFNSYTSLGNETEII